MILALFEHPEGFMDEGDTCFVYDLERGEAHARGARVRGPALRWCIARDRDSLAAARHEGAGHPLLEVELHLAPTHDDADRVVRLDRVDFPPGGVAYRHVHPGPGIRYLLHGELTIDRGDGAPVTYRAGGAWFEGAEEPVLATASPAEDTAFVRLLLLPATWAGKRTIRYLDPADEERPKLQRATILLEEPLAL